MTAAGTRRPSSVSTGRSIANGSESGAAIPGTGHKTKRDEQ